MQTEIGRKVELREEMCAVYAEKLLSLNPQHWLLQYYRFPKDGEEWRKIRKQFFDRFGKKDCPGDNSVGYPALAHFYGALFIALLEACRESKQNG